MKSHLLIIGSIIVLIGLVICAVSYFSNQNPITEFKNKFSQEKSEIAKTTPVTIFAVGDIMLSRDVDRVIKSKGDYNYPFLETAAQSQSADISFANLETSIAPGRSISTDEMTFRSDPETLQGLKWAGFNIVSLANNHTPDFGQKGLLDTFRYLDDAQIQYVGAGKNYSEAHQAKIIDKNGFKIAFLAYNDSGIVPASYKATENSVGTALAGTSKADLKVLDEDIKNAKKTADFVIVSLHFGTEYASSANSKQQNFAHAAIDSGAEMVIGHHPHVVQNAEIYNGKYIFYSLGNFVFDQYWSEETKKGMAIKFVIDEQGARDFQFMPIMMEKIAQPKFLEGDSADAVISRLDLSQ
jgi:poly-gamma-glutamate synthesis protein (capsule biosynthesis protein)